MAHQNIFALNHPHKFMLWVNKQYRFFNPALYRDIASTDNDRMIVTLEIGLDHLGQMEPSDDATTLSDYFTDALAFFRHEVDSPGMLSAAVSPDVVERLSEAAKESYEQLAFDPTHRAV